MLTTIPSIESGTIPIGAAQRRHVECYLDGKKYLDVHDSTFPGAGKNRYLVQS